MNINRNNYEEFFLLYADNELPAAGKAAVEAFVIQHPDLKAELDMLLQAILPADDQPVFADKESLFRTTDDSLVNMTNYETYFVRYTDDELSNEEKAATEEFVYRHPECQADFESFLQTKLVPDTGIQFPDKSLLYRKPAAERRPVISIYIRYSAAAAILLLAVILWMRQNDSTTADTAEKIAIVEEKQQGATEESNIAAAPLPEAIKTTEPVKAVEPVVAEKTQKRKSPVEERVSETETERSQLAAANPEPRPAIVPGTITDRPLVTDALASNARPDASIDKPVIVETNDAPTVVYATNAAQEDYRYVGNTESITRKTPIRGLLRKASRFIDKNNPLSAERPKGGVFTASNEQE